VGLAKPNTGPFCSVSLHRSSTRVTKWPPHFLATGHQSPEAANAGCEITEFHGENMEKYGKVVNHG